MIYEFLAEGFEEIEAIIPIDLLRRAGIEIATVGIGSREVTGAHGITVTADLAEDEICTDTKLKGIILPGGMPGTLNLDKSETVDSVLDFAVKNNLLVAAICAAPTIPGKRGLLTGKKATCYPDSALEKQLKGSDFSTDAVCIDGNFITSRGAGTAFDFALAVIEYFKGRETSDSIAEAIVKCPM